MNDELDLSVESNNYSENTYYKMQEDKKYTEKSIDVYPTHIEIYPYKKGEVFSLEKALSSWLFKARHYKPFAYTIRNKILYVPRGINIELLERTFGVPASYIQINTSRCVFEFNYTMKVPPRDSIQEESINFLVCRGRFASYYNNSQFALTLRTGYGKSYCAIAAMIMLKLRTMIFIHRTTIERQWIDYITTYTTVPEMNITILNSMAQLEDIKRGYLKSDIYIVTHQLIALYARKTSWYDVSQVFKNSGIGLKIFDEAHMYIENLFMIDSFSNISKTFYLSGTLERTDKKENQIIKMIFGNTYKFGSSISYEANKHIIYIPVIYNSRAGDYENAKIRAHGVFSSYRYIEYTLMNPHNSSAMMALNYVIEDIKQKVDGQTLFVTPKIESVDVIADILKNKVDDPSTVKTIYSKNDSEVNLANRDAKFISSTIKSTGIGFSPKALQALVCMEPVASSIAFKQLLGRLDRYIPGVPTYFYDLVDTSLLDVRKNYDETHLAVMKTIAKKIHVVEI